MAGYHVFLRIACPKPTAAALAFLGPMRATAAYDSDRLTVQIEVEAGDVAAALARARDLVLGQLDGTIEHATVTATDGLLVPSGRLFRRKRNR